MNIKTGLCIWFLVVGLVGCSAKKTADPELAGICEEI